MHTAQPAAGPVKGPGVEETTGAILAHTVEKGRITRQKNRVTHKSTIGMPKDPYSFENSSLWSYRKFALEDKVSEREAISDAS